MAAGPLQGKGEKPIPDVSENPDTSNSKLTIRLTLGSVRSREVQDWVTARILNTKVAPTMATPRGDALDKLSMANDIAEWLYFSQLTGTIERESYDHWKLWLEGVPGAGEYFKLLSAPEYNNLQGKVLSDFAIKLKRKTWP